jgi:hypothetical protein
MNTKQTMGQVVEFSHMVVGAYVQDLDEEHFFVRSVPGTNHIAWQLGHLISSTAQMIQALGHAAPELPAGFAAAHTKETAGSDDPQQFARKDQYLELARQMHQASLAAIEATPDSAMEQPGPEPMREYCPTVASVLLLLGTHWLMHAGQFAPIRRKLGKPPLF